MAAFQDGSILIMDKERDDVAFSVPNPPTDNGYAGRYAFFLGDIWTCEDKVWR